MLISEFLQNRLEVALSAETTTALNQLAGQEFSYTHFYASYEEAVKRLYEWMPLYVFPLGTDNHGSFGFYLRPEDLARPELPIVYMSKGLFRPTIIECAPSFKAFVYRTLVTQNAVLNSAYAPIGELDPLVNIASELFGADFFTPVQGEMMTKDWEFIPSPDERELNDEDQYRWMIEAGFGSALDYYTFSDEHFTPDFDAVLEQGFSLYPSCLAIQLAWIRNRIEEGNREAAAKQYVQSLDQYYHTLYFGHFEETYMKLGQELLAQVPQAFDKHARAVVTTWTEPLVRFEESLKFYGRGEPASAVKHLNDFCFLLTDYEREPILTTLRQMYQELGWQWAVALVDIRLERLRRAREDFPEITPEVAAAWKPIIRKWVGLDQSGE